MTTVSTNPHTPQREPALTDLRRLTSFEVDKLDRLRVQFSGTNDAGAVVAEAALDMAMTPVPTPCPSWCDYAEGHTYESADGTVATRSEVSRFHEQGVGDHFTVCREETVSLVDGSVTTGAPYVSVLLDQYLDVTGADRFAECATQAAKLLREIAGAA